MPVVINGTTGISGVAGSNATPAIQGTDTNTGLVFPAADTIAFVEGGTEVMRIDSNGYVGIGTTAPAYILDIVSSQNSASIVRHNNPNSGSLSTSYFQLLNGSGSAGLNIGVQAAGAYSILSGFNGIVSQYYDFNNHFFRNSSGTSTMSINSTGDMTLTSNNLTLGTRSIAANGYTRLPNGLILQWGVTGNIGQDSSGSVTFPIAFPSAVYCITITGRQAINTTSGGLDTISTQSTTGFTIAHGGDGTSSFYWMAIGV